MNSALSPLKPYLRIFYPIWFMLCQTSLILTTSVISFLSFSAPIFALNPKIGNTFDDQSLARVNIGQSFINDPTGSGVNISLNSWVFDFLTPTDATTASNRTLNIFVGIGTGGAGGIPVGSSLATTLTPVTGYEFPVTWTFDGGLQLIDTSVYTAVISGSTAGLRATGIDIYPNGSVTDDDSGVITFDAAFEGNFTSVPFEFSPASGILALGGIYAVSRLSKKVKKSIKKLLRFS